MNNVIDVKFIFFIGEFYVVFFRKCCGRCIIYYDWVVNLGFFVCVVWVDYINYK